MHLCGRRAQTSSESTIPGHGLHGILHCVLLLALSNTCHQLIVCTRVFRVQQCVRILSTTIPPEHSIHHGLEPVRPKSLLLEESLRLHHILGESASLSASAIYWDPRWVERLVGRVARRSSGAAGRRECISAAAADQECISDWVLPVVLTPLSIPPAGRQVGQRAEQLKACV